MFEYFQSYPWNLAMLVALQTGAVISEVDEVCRPLRDVSDRDVDGATNDWVRAWRSLGEKLDRQAQRDEAASHCISAARKYFRGAIYYLMAERPMAPSDPAKLEVYRLGIGSFRKGIELSPADGEFVEIPYGKSHLPAVFVPASVPGPAPCVIFFNGFDSIKEFQYLTIGNDWSRRGLACLYVDQPGSGGALRLNGIPAEVESERPAAACVDYLQKRSDVNPSSIGIYAVSLGGYYAPRAAAFEKRLKFCVAHGALYDAGEVVAMRAQQGAGYARSVPHVDEHLKWVMGCASAQEAVAKLLRFSLKGVAEKITCPVLIFHGGGDRQLPGDQGQKTYDAAVNSPNRKLIVLGPEDGGIEHCSIDNMSLATDLEADWILDTLKPQQARASAVSVAR